MNEWLNNTYQAETYNLRGRVKPGCVISGMKEWMDITLNDEGNACLSRVTI